MRLRLDIKRPYSNIRIEESSLNELVEDLKCLHEWLVIFDELVTGGETEDTIERNKAPEDILARALNGRDGLKPLM